MVVVVGRARAGLWEVIVVQEERRGLVAHKALGGLAWGEERDVVLLEAANVTLAKGSHGLASLSGGTGMTVWVVF